MYQKISLPTSISVFGKYSAIGAGERAHHDVQVVHLPAVRNHFDAVRLGHRADLAGLREAADAVRVELKNVERLGLEQVVESVAGELVLAAGERDVGDLAELGEIVNFIWQQQLLRPTAAGRARGASSSRRA